MIFARRQFNRMAGATAAIALARRSGFGASGGLRLGLNTWSLRALGQEEALPIILRAMKHYRLMDCELLFLHVEPARFNPVLPVGLLSAPSTQPAPPTPQQLQEEKEKATALTEWRLTVPMSYFEEIRSKFEHQGLQIKSYAVSLGSSSPEIERQFLMTKALGAQAMIVRLPEAMTAVVASAADRHRMIVGLQFSDVEKGKAQLTASRNFRLDPDIGDLTHNGADALAFVRANLASMMAIDLKDSLVGGPSVAFGTGTSHMREVLQFLASQHVPLTAYVDCDYPDTGRSTEEIGRCVQYIHQCLHP